MRIVFVTAYPPSRLHPRSYGYVTSLAQRHEITVVCLCHSPRDIMAVTALRTAGIAVTPVFEEPGTAFARAASALLSDRSPRLAYDASPKLREAVLAEIAQGDVSLVHVEHLRAASAAIDLPVPTVWDAVSCMSLLTRLSRGQRARGVPRRFAGSESRRVREDERALLSAYTHVTVSSERDLIALLGSEQRPGTNGDDETLAELAGAEAARALPARTPATVRVLPSGVDLEYFSPGPHRRHPNRLIFSGKLDSPMNAAALDLLMREIMPRIWRVREDVHLTIAGCRPSRRMRAYGNDPRVSVTGYAADIRPYLSGAAVAVSPLPYAVGAQDAVLEAMAMGTPVVASDAATGGLSGIPGRDLLLASTPDRFAHQVLRLLDDGELWRSLSRNGRSYVERHHALPLVTRQLEALYRDASGHNFTLPSAGPVRATAKLTMPLAAPVVAGA